MNRKRSAYAACALVALIASIASGGTTACDAKSCEKATDSMEGRIREVCKEDGFKDTPFCACCVAANLFSVDDTCACRPLVLDAEQCYYDDDSAGNPSTRTALKHAADVCSTGTVTFKNTFTQSLPAACARFDGGTSSSSDDAGTSQEDASPEEDANSGATDASDSG